MSDSKTVFALRKQGQTEDALKLGREVFQKDPKDPWNVRALAWCSIAACRRRFISSAT